MKKSFKVLVVTTFFLLSAVGVSAQTTGAYSAPSGAPPTGNVAAPINVGPASQTKTGLLRVDGGFYNTGTSVFERRVEIGICPSCDYATLDPVKDFAQSNSVKSAFGALGNSFASLFQPKTVNAQAGGFRIPGGGAGGLDTAPGGGDVDATLVMPMLDVWGGIRQQGVPVCLQDGTNCGTSGAQWTVAGADIHRSTGKVGVGTVPGYPLHLKSNATYDMFTLEQASNGKKWSLGTPNGQTYFTISEVGIDSRLAVTAGGNVGIGLTNPTAKLHVNGDGKIGNVELVDNQGGSIELGAGGSATTPFIDFRGNGSASADFNARIINNANGQLSFQNAGGEKMKVVNTSQSVVVTNSVPVYLDLCQTGGKVSMNSTTGCGTNTLLGYLLPPPPAAPPSAGPVPTVTGLGTSGYGGHAVGATLITINFDGRYTSTTPLNRVGAEVRIASSGAYIGAGHNPATTYDFSGSTYSSPAGTNVNFSVPGMAINCGVNYQWRIWARNSSGIGYGSWMTYFIAC